MSTDLFTSISATIGGGLLLGFAIKKVVKLLAVVDGLFIAGLTYLQYQQVAYFDWEKIERMVTIPKKVKYLRSPSMSIEVNFDKY